MKKTKIKKNKYGKLQKRIISMILVISMFTLCMPMEHFADLFDTFKQKITVYAVGTGTPYQFNNIGEFQRYAESYNADPSAHRNDILKFNITGDSSNREFENCSLHNTESTAFDGTIMLANGMQFNLNEPLFTYVTDDVVIQSMDGGPATIIFTRYNPGSYEPLFAKYVVLSRSSGDPVVWNFEYSAFGKTDKRIYNIAGFLGTLKNGAKVEIGNISFNNLGEDTVDLDGRADIIANDTGDAGLVCGTIEQNSQLQIDSISCLSEDKADRSYSITASGSGHAGGLVGRMDTGSKLLLGSTLTNFQAADAHISAPGGYAGGIVGKCDGGVICKVAVTRGVDYSGNDVVEPLLNEGNIDAGSDEKTSEELNKRTIKRIEENRESDADSAPEAEAAADAYGDTADTDITGAEDVLIEETDSDVPGPEVTDDFSDEAEVKVSEEDIGSEDTDTEEKPDEEIVIKMRKTTLRGVGDTSSIVYTVSQNIDGNKGSGGVAGYYRATTNNSSENASVDTNIVDLKTGGYKVNNTGACGGLFGEVFNNGTNMTITANEEVRPNHTDGVASIYGGLIGKYYASAQTLSLTVEGTSTIAPSRDKTDAASVSFYGGVIGIVDKDENNNSAYVKINGITVNSSNAIATSYFGGVIAKADEAFIHLSVPAGVNDDKNKISYSGISTDKNFAGVVGSLETGVLYLCDGTDLSGAQTISGATAKSGQIVGYRNCGFVFAKSGWKLYRSTVGQKVDDIGSWGEVIRFNDTTFLQSDVIILDETNHYVKIKWRKDNRSDCKNIPDTTNFANIALNAQHNSGTDGNVLKFADKTNFTSTKILTGNDFSINSGATIDLRGTGITGLTRDNSYNGTDLTSYLEFKGTSSTSLRNMNGVNATVILASGEAYGETRSTSYGNGTIYRHKYNGLIARTNNVSFSNGSYGTDKMTISGTINVNACLSDISVGSLVSDSTNKLQIDYVDCTTTITHSNTGNVTGYNIGGFVGKVEGNIVFGANNNRPCNFNGSIISGTSGSSATVGGLIGYISANSFTSAIKNTTVKGTIKSQGTATDHKIGGVIGVIGGSGNSTSRTLKLENDSVDGLNVESSATNSSGGLLGYNWFKTDVTFGDGSSVVGVELKNGSTMKSNAQNTAGLVYEASGYWKVQTNGSNGGIKITSVAIDAANAASFGGIINRGAYSDSAIYLELANNSYVITLLDMTELKSTVSVFDELVAYSKFDNKNICDNSQGIVSINVGDKLKMGNDDTTNTGSTYQKQTSFVPSDYCNPNTRYYYNLDQYRENSNGTVAEKFFIWSVKQYAHSTIQSYFSAASISGLSSSSDLDLRGYSYYPIDISSSTTIKGNLHLYNKEFDETENGTTCKRKSLGTTRSSQHYTMHNSLFRNVTSSLTLSDLTLDGNVSIIDGTANNATYCGALIMGTVGNSSSAKPATVTINNLTLNGIRINGYSGTVYAPLIINKCSSNATFDITNVNVGTTAYDSGAIIASSLMGDLGSSSASSVKISFSDIRLDGRNNTGVDSSLNDVYPTTRSLFSRATLLNSLAYSDSSSYGKYYYDHGEDWNDTTNAKIGHVTYGAEIVSTVENKTGPTDTPPNTSKQNKYNNSNYYTHPTDYNAAAQYDDFASKYQNYVYTGYNITNNTHELRVNITANEFGGCGTYNDPYIITSHENFETIAQIINGTYKADFKIALPATVASAPDVSWCVDANSDGEADHIKFEKYTGGSTRSSAKWSNADNTKELSDEKLAKYLAGAYYQISEDVTENIVLASNFEGFSNNVDSAYLFHGVIDGNGKTIINQSTNPLVASSNGCVIRDLTISVKPATAKTINTNYLGSNIKFQSATGGCEFYGAVIGQIFGGDNIIEKVSVGFEANSNGNKIIINNNSSANFKLVPVGGYVGVVVDGGLVFKNMSATSHEGITYEQFSNFDPLGADSGYLYINPIIGRVINGYAVNEGSAYHWSETEGERSDENGVTLHNGTKNYSIADIYPELDKLDPTTVTIPAEGEGEPETRNVIKFPNAQSMFILSILTQSSTTANTSSSDATAYSKSGRLHNADYDEIGEDALITGDYASVSATYPYIVKNYTETPGNILNLTSSGTAWDFSLGGTSPSAATSEEGEGEGGEEEPEESENASEETTIYDTWYLPDGFRGIGCIGFNMTSDTEMAKRTFSLHRFNGTNLYGEGTAIVDLNMNMSLKHYEDGYDNYLPISTSHGGFGLFNKFRHNNTGTVTDDDIISDLKLSGKINYDVVKSSGTFVYNSSNVKKSTYLHVGGLAGCIGSGADSDTDKIRVKQIKIDGLEINGFESAGGFFGYMVMANSANGEVTITDVTADTFTVTAKRYAGGMIGYFGQGNLSVSDVTITQPNILIYYTGGDRKDFNNGAGGIVGYALNNSSNSPIQFSDVQLGALKSASQDPSSFSISSRIGYAESVVFVTSNPGTNNSSHNDTAVAGGLVGRSHTIVKSGNTYSMILTDCKVYNVDVYGHKVGGLLGSDIDKDSKIHIKDCKLISDTENKAQIYGNTIDSKDRGCGGIIGGNSNGGLFVDDCQVQGYILQGRNDTAAVCAWEDSGIITIHNLMIKDIVIRSDYCGSLVGYQNADILGYNILTDNIQFQDKSGNVVTNLTDTNKNVFIGYLVGKNLNGKATKIVGFTRQNTTPETGYFVPDRMTGQGSKSTKGNNCVSSTTTSFGNGYVIFSDYKGNFSGTAYSDINATSPFTGTASSPYVLTSPKVSISNSQILTGDGVSGTAYISTAANSIINDIKVGSSAKRYQCNGLTDAQVTALKSILTNKISGFRSEMNKANIPYTGTDFPVLVIDDITTVNDTIVNYIKLLTNSSYNYRFTGDSNVPYSIVISKWKFNSSTGVFEKQSGDAALKFDTSTTRYTISTTDYDNTDTQFSMVDVQFKDPSNTNKIAYHLYIPVMVEKMLYYNVTLRPASGTEYRLDAYPDKTTNLIDNLGNPVTMKVTYSYEQSNEVWARSINNGENVQRNYQKKLMLRVTHASGNGIPSDSQLILVDPNNNADRMYSAAFDSTSTALLEQTDYGSGFTMYDLKLTGFSGFTVCNMNDLMKVSVDTTATEKNLVECSSGQTATVIINDPSDPNYNKRLRLKQSGETGTYAVKVSGWDSNTFNVLDENYYISIFTKDNSSDNTIYHYEFDADTSFRDSAYPSARMNTEVTHIILGNLYNNSINLHEDNSSTVISRSNNYLEATLTSDVGFKGEAIDNNIMSYIEENEDIAIYQTFLVSLQKIKDGAASQGIVLTPECSFEYSVNGVPITNTEKKPVKDLGTYIEFPTSHSIKDALCTAAHNWDSVNKNNENDCRITITAKVRMSYANYDTSMLSSQFPETTGLPTNTNGTKMIGYSNISSSSENASASRASVTTLNDGNNRLLYYMENARPVTLSYKVNENAEFLNDGNANFGQLGINAHPSAGEVTDGLSPICSLISYDASEYTKRRDARYMKVEIELSDKNNSYATPLNIATYLDQLQLLSNAGNSITKSNDDSTATKYVYKIPLSSIKEMGTGTYEYEVPVNFGVYTGEGDAFQDRNLTYSNYRVFVSVSLLDENQNKLPGSDASDWIIYTNAKVFRDIVNA